MGNKTTRQQRERIEQYETDKEKRELDWVIKDQAAVFDQAEILARYLHLEKLKLTFEGQDIRDISVFKEAIQSNDLSELYIDCSQTSVGDEDFLGELTKLSRLTLLARGTRISDLTGIGNLLVANNKLEYVFLDISGTKASSLKELDLSRAVDLKHFILVANDIRTEHVEGVVQSLSKCTKLEELRLEFSNTQIREVQIIGWLLKQVTGLLQFTLKLNKTPVEELIDVLSGISSQKLLKHLTLELRNSQVKELDQLGEALKYCQRLEYLSVQIEDSEVEGLDNFFSKMGYLSSLLSLSLGIKNTKASLSNLRKSLDAIQKLQYLKLSVNANVEDRLLLAISQLESLKTLILDLSHSEITEIYAFTNQPPKNLRHLHLLLNDSKIKELNLANLSTMSNLRTLQLDLSGSAIERVIGLEEEVQLLKTLVTLDINTAGTKLKFNLSQKELKFLKEFNLIQS